MLRFQLHQNFCKIQYRKKTHIIILEALKLIQWYMKYNFIYLYMFCTDFSISHSWEYLYHHKIR